jgi:hypothetical protein
VEAESGERGRGKGQMEEKMGVQKPARLAMRVGEEMGRV